MPLTWSKGLFPVGLRILRWGDDPAWVPGEPGTWVPGSGFQVNPEHDHHCPYKREAEGHLVPEEEKVMSPGRQNWRGGPRARGWGGGKERAPRASRRRQLS